MFDSLIVIILFIRYVLLLVLIPFRRNSCLKCKNILDISTTSAVIQQPINCLVAVLTVRLEMVRMWWTTISIRPGYVMLSTDNNKSYIKYPFEKQMTKYANSEYESIIFKANNGSNNRLRLRFNQLFTGIQWQLIFRKSLFY